MDIKKLIPPAACLIASIIALGGLLANYDNIVISYGIRSFQTARLVSIAAILACAAWTALSVRKASKTKRTYEIPEAPEENVFDEKLRKNLYYELANFGEKKWHGLPSISTLLSQLDSMDEYQSEMGRLLDQTDYLKQKPAEIVQKVEDCMYVNIRKLLNYMRIIQTRDPGTMRAKIAECEEKNADLLRKTDDFVVAVVAYVNGDIAVGEEEKARTSVDEYMYVVLQAIDLPETRLG